MSRRSEELISSVKNMNAVHALWAADVNRPLPDATYWDAVDRLREAFAAGEIPGELRELSDAVDSFLEEDGRFDGTLNGGMPTEEFFRCRQFIEETLNADESPELKPLETIQQLIDQKVSPLQICAIYGFKDKFGRPMEWLINNELRLPGSVLKTPKSVDGRDWEDPRVTKLRETNASRAAIIKVNTAKREQVASAPAAPCPESALDLWNQNVPAGQAAKMLGASEGKVGELFALLDTVKESGESVENAWALEKDKFDAVEAAEAPKARRGRAVATA